MKGKVMRADAQVVRLRDYFAERADHVRSLRRELHAIPELGFSENETSAYIQRFLKSIDVPFVSGIGTTGIVARIGKEGGPVVAIRADMDGLPIREENECPYRSRHEGLMHACGHDAHTAMLIGVAAYLKSIEAEIPGEVLLIFQPAEERSDGAGLTGARYVLQSDLLKGARAVLGVHVMSDGPAGAFGILHGPAMASGDMFTATIYGRGGHDALVHQTIDPIYLAVQVLDNIYAIRSRRIDPMKCGTISVGSVESGTTANVIPDSARLSGAIRAFDAETRKSFSEGLEKALEVAKTLGGHYELAFPVRVPATSNDTALATVARGACVDLYGADSLYACAPSMAVEDFSWYSLSFPSLFIMLGAGIGDGVLRPHHNPLFDIEDSILYRGSALLALTALRVLGSGETPGEGEQHGER